MRNVQALLWRWPKIWTQRKNFWKQGISRCSLIFYYSPAYCRVSIIKASHKAKDESYVYRPRLKSILILAEVDFLPFSIYYLLILSSGDNTCELLKKWLCYAFVVSRRVHLELFVTCNPYNTILIISTHPGMTTENDSLYRFEPFSLPSMIRQFIKTPTSLRNYVYEPQRAA